MKYNLETLGVEALWIHFEVYGDHEAAVILCDRALDGDKEAMVYATKIWNGAGR